MEKRGIEYDYEPSSHLIVYVEPSKTRKYQCDFVIRKNNLMIESKGLFDLDSRKKMALVIEQNPKLDIRMVFQRDQPINKGAKTTYSEWCDKRGIKYAIGEIPDEWLEELEENNNDNPQD